MLLVLFFVFVKMFYGQRLHKFIKCAHLLDNVMRNGTKAKRDAHHTCTHTESTVPWFIIEFDAYSLIEWRIYYGSNQNIKKEAPLKLMMTTATAQHQWYYGLLIDSLVLHERVWTSEWIKKINRGKKRRQKIGARARYWYCHTPQSRQVFGASAHAHWSYEQIVYYRIVVVVVSFWLKLLLAMFGMKITDLTIYVDRPPLTCKSKIHSRIFADITFFVVCVITLKGNKPQMGKTLWLVL